MVLQKDASGDGVGTGFKSPETRGGGSDPPPGGLYADREGNEEPLRGKGAACGFSDRLGDPVHFPLRILPKGPKGTECAESQGASAGMFADLRKMRRFV